MGARGGWVAFLDSLEPHAVGWSSCPAVRPAARLRRRYETGISISISTDFISFIPRPFATSPLPHLRSTGHRLLRGQLVDSRAQQYPAPRHISPPPHPRRVALDPAGRRGRARTRLAEWPVQKITISSQNGAGPRISFFIGRGFKHCREGKQSHINRPQAQPGDLQDAANRRYQNSA